MRYVKFLALFCVIIAPVFAEGIRLNNWKSYTAMSNARAVATDSKGRYWVACNGGAYCFNPADSSYIEFRNDNGLLSIDLTEVYADTLNKKIYFGSSSGNIDICTEDFQWTNFLDIKNVGFSNSQINSITSYNNKIYIGGGFGLAIFDPKQNIFLEDVKRLGNFNSQTEVTKILILNDSIWLTTNQGLAIAPIMESIVDRSIWRNITRLNSIALNNLVDIKQSGDSLLLVSSDGFAYSLKDNTLNKIFQFDKADNLIGIFSHNNQLFVHTAFTIFNMKGEPDYSLPYKSRFNKIYDNLNSSIVLAYTLNSICVVNSSSINYYSPPTPISNGFIAMDVDKQGLLWAVGGRTYGRGVMFLDNGVWTNITPSQYPMIRDEVFTKVSPLSDGSVNFAGYGSGLLNIRKTGNKLEFDTLTSLNSPYVGYNDAARYVLMGNSKEDTYGNVWTINARALDGSPMMFAKTKTGYYPHINCDGSNKNSYFTLEIDGNNTKWLATSNPDVFAASDLGSWGLHYFNERGTFDNENDDFCGTITTGNYPLLKNNTNLDLKVDKSGYLWIASANGLSVLVNPSAALSKSPKFIFREIRALNETLVRQIMVDALDNKWLATPKGVYVLNADGSEVLATYNTSNSPLATNDVYSLATNVNTGEIYIGTTRGLFSASSLSIEPKDDFSLICYPQPYKPSKDGLFVIDGLTENSDVKVITEGGQYVRSFQTIGRTITWDGRNESGTIVPTGVYLVIATSKTNGQSAITKFALIRD